MLGAFVFIGLGVWLKNAWAAFPAIMCLIWALLNDTGT
jgi:hypothetical protein